MGMMRRVGGWGLVLVVAGAFLWSQCSPTGKTVEVSCLDIVKGCAIKEEATLRFDRQPDALKPFALFVTWPGAREIHASFQMEGMEMGFNRYRLVERREGQWQAEVMLPACIQGRKDWRVELDVDGVRYVLPFRSR